MKFLLDFGPQTLTVNTEAIATIWPAPAMNLEIRYKRVSDYNPSGVTFWVAPVGSDWDENANYQKWQNKWDFGMGAGKTFANYDANIDIANNRNIQTATVATNVFYDAGDFDIEVEVKTPSGYTVTLQTTVTVLNIDDVVWDTDVYLDVDSLWPGATGQTLVSTAAGAKTAMAANVNFKRLLVKAGTVVPIYDSINLSGGTFAYVGRIGAGDDPYFKPDWIGRRDNVDAGWTIGETYFCFKSWTSTSTVVHDVDFISDYAPLTGTYTDGRMSGVEAFFGGSLMMLGGKSRGMSMSAYPNDLSCFIAYDWNGGNWGNYGWFGSAEVVGIRGGQMKMDADVRSFDGKGLTVNPNYPDHGAIRFSWHSFLSIDNIACHTTTSWSVGGLPAPNPNQPDIRLMQDSRYTPWEVSKTTPNVRVTYSVGFVVYENVNFLTYTCIVAHTSTGDFAADLASGYWELKTTDLDTFRVSHIGNNALGSSIAFQRQNGTRSILRGTATSIVNNRWVFGEMTAGALAIELGGALVANNHHHFPDQPSMKDTYPTFDAGRYASWSELRDGGSDMLDKISKRPVDIINNTVWQGQKADKVPEAFSLLNLNSVEYIADINIHNNHIIGEFVPNAFEFDIESNSDVDGIPTAGPSFGTGTGTFYDYKLGAGVDGVTTLEDRLGNVRPLTGANKGSVG